MSGYHATSSHEVSAPASSLEDVSADVEPGDDSVVPAVSSVVAAPVDPLSSAVSAMVAEVPEIVDPPPAQPTSPSATSTLALRRLSRRRCPTISG